MTFRNKRNDDRPSPQNARCVFSPPKNVLINKNNHERSIHYIGDHPTIAETIPNKKKYILFNQAASIYFPDTINQFKT